MQAVHKNRMNVSGKFSIVPVSSFALWSRLHDRAELYSPQLPISYAAVRDGFLF